MKQSSNQLSEREISSPGPALDSDRPSINLMNTSWREADGPVDWLQTDDGVGRFAAAHGFEVKTGQTSSVRATLIETRRLLVRLFDPAGDLASDRALQSEINRVLTAARVSWRSDGDGRWLQVSAQAPAEGLSVQAVVDALDLLEDKPDRVRSCDHDLCTVWFVDTSKAGRRRWCSMERCGNRAKARRHYERTAKSVGTAEAGS